MHLREVVRLRPTAADVPVPLGLALCRAGDEAGMAQEHRTVERVAASEPLGELAHQSSESGGPVCAAVHG